MKAYLEKLKNQIQLDPVRFYDGAEQPGAELNDLANHLAFPDADKICCLPSKLTAKHERIAFFTGSHLGAQLMLELATEQKAAPSIRTVRLVLRCHLITG